MSNISLIPPLQEEDIRKLRIGDSVHVTGIVYGIRDATQIRIFDEGVKPPVDLSGSVCLHTAPNVKKVGDRYYPVCVGTTTSTRMERFTPGLLEHYGVKAIVGKGGLLDESVRAMRKFGGCYLAIVGGAAALETTQIEAIEEVYWEDLMPECIWKFRVKDLGPLTVAIDSHGGDLYAQVKNEARKKMQGLLQELSGSESKNKLKN
jgi:L(+)-tartrate dehydratase beta subunit